MQTYAVEPADSPVISGGEPGPHSIQGIGAGFIPKVLNTSLLDGTISVGKDESFEYMGKAASMEGVLVGISSGATLAAIARKIPELPAGSRILGFCYDTGERYLSLL
jgi:cysteine synthase A